MEADNGGSGHARDQPGLTCIGSPRNIPVWRSQAGGLRGGLKLRERLRTLQGFISGDSARVFL